MGKRTSEELRAKANRMDAIAALQRAVKALREDDDVLAKAAMKTAAEKLQGQAAE